MNRSTHAKSSLRKRIATALAGAALLAPFMADALPVIPNAAGFGIDTPAGRGGKVYRVTNLNDSGAGSLRECALASGPRVCVFEVSGTIRLKKDLSITNPNITIAGQTAPSPGIMLRGAALRISTSDVLVQHIRVRAGDDPDGPNPENRDALKIESDNGVIRNIVVDHCSFAWAIDETASLWLNWDNVTLSNNIFAEALDNSLHPKGPHGYGVLFGPYNGKVTFVGNLLAHMADRNPLSRAGQMVMVNNVVYNRKVRDVDLQSERGIVTKNTIIGNVFIRGRDHANSVKPVAVHTEGNQFALPSASRIYLADNHALDIANSAKDPMSLLSPIGNAVPLTPFLTNAPPTWPAGLTRLATSDSVVLDHVLRSAGARPADRDPVDARIVDQVRKGTGQIINCVAPDGSARCQKNAGGWPNLAQNRRTLTLPENYNEVTPSGYTRLELWLHELAAQVEGRSPRPPAAPVLAGG
jgi:pectate lyase